MKFAKILDYYDGGSSITPKLPRKDQARTSRGQKKVRFDRNDFGFSACVSIVSGYEKKSETRMTAMKKKRKENCYFELSVTNLLSLRNLWRNKFWQRLQKGCRKPMYGYVHEVLVYDILPPTTAIIGSVTGYDINLQLVTT